MEMMQNCKVRLNATHEIMPNRHAKSCQIDTRNHAKSAPPPPSLGRGPFVPEAKTRP
jgi:hypothetical protein